MAKDTVTYLLSHVKQSLPPEILEMAFKPGKYNTTVEQRIITEVIEGPILDDCNLVAGKRRDIILNPSWKLDIDPEPDLAMAGSGLQGAYYKIPEGPREGRNIASVVGIIPSLVSSLPGSVVSYNGQASMGNTAGGLISEMLNTRTMGQYPITPLVTLEGTNIIRFFPEQLIEGCVVSVFLEYDADFLNLNNSGIIALRKLVLCAVQKYIGTNLRLPVGETEIVAGMEISDVREIVNDCIQKGEEYDNLLVKYKGAATFDTRTISRLMWHML